MPTRMIEYKDFILRGIKTPLFPYEILLPENYYMIYDIIGSYFGLREDLDEDIISNIKCRTVFIHNISPKIINIDGVSSIDDIMNIFFNSFLITLYLNINQNIEDISYDYLISNNEYRRLYLSKYLNYLK